MGKNTDKDIPCGNCCPTYFLKGNFPDSMFLSPVTSAEVDSYISQMDNNKSIGPYSIPVALLKILKTHISPLISSLIKDSFLCGIFPSKLKLVKVTPVFKKGSRHYCYGYLINGAVRSKSEMVWDFIDVDIIYRTLHWKYEKCFTSECSETCETT